MYAREINNEIVRCSTLPKEVFANDEWVQLTEQNCGNYGFKPLVQPTYNTRTHKRTTEIIADGSNYTYKVESRGKTLEDLKSELRRELKGYWKTAFEEGKPYSDFLKATNQDMPSDVQTEINNAYTLLSTIKGQINALSTVEAAAAYEFPMTDINAALDYMRDLI